MTTAKLEYRSYDGLDIAITCTSLEFYGEHSDELNGKWYKAKRKGINKHKSTKQRKIECAQEKLNCFKREYNKLIMKRPWWRFWRNESERNVYSCIVDFIEELECITQNDTSYLVTMLDAKYFLESLGAVLIDKTSYGINTNSPVEVEIYRIPNTSL